MDGGARIGSFCKIAFCPVGGMGGKPMKFSAKQTYMFWMLPAILGKAPTTEEWEDWHIYLEVSRKEIAKECPGKDSDYAPKWHSIEGLLK